MEYNVLRAKRAGYGYTTGEVGDALGMAGMTYARKELHPNRFTDVEKVMVSKFLHFTPAEMNEYLYGGILPIKADAVWEDAPKSVTVSFD